MSRIGYIATLIYLPFLVFYSSIQGEMLTGLQQLLLNKAYFLMQSIVVFSLSAQIFYYEFSKHKRLLMCSMCVIQSVFIVYLFVDWSEALVYNRYVCAAFALIAIASFAITIIKTKINDRKDKR